MIIDIRTARKKLVGKYDESVKTFTIKNCNKSTLIEVPDNGLRLIHTPGDGISETVFIPQKSNIKVE